MGKRKTKASDPDLFPSKKKARGRPEFQRTKDTDKVFARMVKAKATEDLIAAAIGIDPKTLRKHYTKEIQIALGERNEAVAAEIVRRGLAGSDILLIFYAKTQMGWSEKNSPDPEDKQAPVQIQTKEENGQTPHDMASLARSAETPR